MVGAIGLPQGKLPRFQNLKGLGKDFKALRRFEGNIR